jgi:tRNA threonylcarbamoyladenosine biosynthesis protein TsaB
VVWLALDTSAPVAVVALVDVVAIAVVAEITLSETRRHAEALPAAVDEALARAGVDVASVEGIGVGVGPGSFIGVRTGIAFAKGLGRAIARPVVGVPSLLALALSPTDLSTLPRGTGLVVVDAKRGERYVATVDHGDTGVVVVDDTRAVADAALKSAPDAAGPAFVIGATTGLTLGDVVVVDRAGPSALGLARALARSDRHDERASLVPLYVRPPDAKLPALDPARHRPDGVGTEGTP